MYHSSNSKPTKMSSPYIDGHIYEVIIVGAGITGLAAAQRLSSKNLNDILILEAESVIGGRVCTSIDNRGGCVELGAQWLHGDKGNPLYPVLDQHGLVGYSGEALRECMCEDDFKKNTFYTADGDVIPTELLLKIVRVQNKVGEMIKHEYDLQSDLPFGKFKMDALEKAYNTQFPDRAHHALHKSFTQWYEKQLSFSEGVENFDRSSLPMDDKFDDCGGRNFYFPLGTSSITKIFDDVFEKVVLNTSVTKFSLDNDGVTLSTVSGFDYQAKKCIVTCSLGVLKANVDRMFVPALPNSMREAIKGMYIGKVEKIIVVLEKPFWTEDLLGLSLVDTGLPKDFIREVSSITGDQNEWWRGIVEVRNSSSNNHALYVWMNGEDARQSLRYSNDVLLKVIYLLIKQYTGISITSDAEIYRSSWSTNPHFLGSFSAVTSESHGQLQKFMLEPVMYANMPRLWFAGEAYHPTFFSTLHGAYDCGRKQADSLIDHV